MRNNFLNNKLHKKWLVFTKFIFIFILCFIFMGYFMGIVLAYSKNFNNILNLRLLRLSNIYILTK